jgi:activator of HSP90 ATPase
MKDFKHYIKIKAKPEDVYACLTNPFTIELWSGYQAQMKAEENTEFEMWDGDIAGRILKLEKDRLVEQEWYFGDQEEKSIVTIKIHPGKGGVSVELKHTNIPDVIYEEMVEGWREHYLGRIKGFLEL